MNLTHTVGWLSRITAQTQVVRTSQKEIDRNQCQRSEATHRITSRHAECDNGRRIHTYVTERDRFVRVPWLEAFLLEKESNFCPPLAPSISQHAACCLPDHLLHR